MDKETSIIQQAEALRSSYLEQVIEQHQAEFSQYFTPVAVAEIMSSFVNLPQNGTVRVLDPGAGSGILMAALVEYSRLARPHLKLEITAVEKDKNLLPVLQQTLDTFTPLGHTYEIINADFIQWGTEELWKPENKTFDIVLQNPPYKKLSSSSETDRLLKGIGVHVPNLYAAFMSLGQRLLSDSGEQISITPRSWMNGTYYKKFRQDFLNYGAITHIHTFESRSKVFGDTGVLQESIIVRIVNGVAPEYIEISISEDHTTGSSKRLVPYKHVCTEDFVFVPASEDDALAVAWMDKAHSSLEDLGISVSTGKVVDFRAQDLLVQEPSENTYPFIFSSHIKSGEIKHPLESAKKPQWFAPKDDRAIKQLVPEGTYVLTKRFSSKEEKRRISAGIVTNNHAMAFDNKTNYFHANGESLELKVAQGLVAWLNSSFVDRFFRVFSGHTQVNATDLRQMKFPTRYQLIEMGKSASITDSDIEKIMGSDS